MTLYPGIEAQCIFTVPFYSSTLQGSAIATFAQDGKEVFTIAGYVSASGSKSTIRIDLDQSYTLKLKPGMPCDIQLNLESRNGYRLPSAPITVPVGAQYHRVPYTAGGSL